MQISELLVCDDSAETLTSYMDGEVLAITANHSEVVGDGVVFIAIVGEQINGINFVEDAFNNGAMACIVPTDYKDLFHAHENVIFVEDTRAFLAKSTFYLYKEFIPSHILTVSGTNGKSSVSFFVSQLLGGLNIKNMIIGTLGIYVDGEKVLDSLTTPTPSVIAEYFKKASLLGIQHVIMESSSHGITQKRIEGINFATAGFTNLTQDHLDYHTTMEEYFYAKRRLYTEVVKNPVVINVDDEYGVKLKQDCIEHDMQVLDYGKNADELKIIEIKKINDIQIVQLKYKDKMYALDINLMGEFQVYNIICAIGMLLICGYAIEDLVKNVSKIIEVEGRLNYIKESKKGKIFIDFAHSPNALEEVLKVLKKDNPTKLKVVFGCGGDRDKLKRHIMGSIAAKYADKIYITDDNPRFEEPNSIRKEILSGIDTAYQGVVVDIQDRFIAIKVAVEELQDNEILLIAGKGHEKGQIIKDKVIPFSDAEVVRKVLS